MPTLKSRILNYFKMIITDCTSGKRIVKGSKTIITGN